MFFTSKIGPRVSDLWWTFFLTENNLQQVDFKTQSIMPEKMSLNLQCYFEKC